MRCTILRSFNYSTTGQDEHWAQRGTEHDIPDGIVPGLEREGYVRPVGKAVVSPERKVIEAAPENQAMTAPQNKRSVGKGPKGLWFVMQDGARVSRGFDSPEAAQAALYDA